MVDIIPLPYCHSESNSTTVVLLLLLVPIYTAVEVYHLVINQCCIYYFIKDLLLQFVLCSNTSLYIYYIYLVFLFLIVRMYVCNAFHLYT